MSEKPEKSESEADTQAGSLPEAEAGSEVAEAGLPKSPLTTRRNPRQPRRRSQPMKPTGKNRPKI